LNLLPNVEAFDDGPKLGLDVIDNGSVIFRNKVIPRDGLLMRYVTVNPDGTVLGLENVSAIKYGYGSMLNLRVQLTFGFSIDFNVFPLQ
jgi:nitrogen fixation/metabolism regulation signal transduction histidine kinase